MRKALPRILMPCLMLAMISNVSADFVTLSGQFEGDESVLAPVSGTCDEPEALLAYKLLGPIKVGEEGVYDVSDAGDQVAVDVVIRVYKDAFDPNSVETNLVGGTIDVADQLTLEAGVDYHVMIQHWCSNAVGTFGLGVSGPGLVTGAGVVPAPDEWWGEFRENDPQADFGLGFVGYQVSGPHRFDVTGTYFFADLGWSLRTDMVLSVYRDSFTPTAVGQNRVATLDDSGTLPLEKGTDYFFVSYPWLAGDVGEWQFALFPPGVPAINPFTGGAWYVEGMEGQGILMEVFPSFELAFLAWFTFADDAAALSARSGDSAVDEVGASSQRWISALGSFDDGADRMSLQFENTSGGAFNTKAPGQEQDTDYGTGTLQVVDCNHLTLTFDLPSAGQSGVNELTRVAPDPQTLQLCEALGLRPGVIK